MFTIKQIKKEETYPLRIDILRNGKAINYHFVGDDLVNTFHLGAFKNEECIGIVTYIPKSNPLFPNKITFQLRGMAVAKPFQKSGIGKFLIEESLEFLNEKKCEILWCNARIIALDFYKKMGFSIAGDKFQIPTVGPHYTMFKNLND